jgi:hypothetical protein
MTARGSTVIRCVNAPDVNACYAKCVRYYGPIIHKTAGRDMLSGLIDGRNGMSGCKRYNEIALREEEWIGVDQQGPDALADSLCKRDLDLCWCCRIHDRQPSYRRFLVTA